MMKAVTALCLEVEYKISNQQRRVISKHYLPLDWAVSKITENLVVIVIIFIDSFYLRV